MQPRLRTIVWRELPPCVRRGYVWTARRLFHAELFLGRLYLSWKRSPTWNFVAIVGTLGILLTILLFLAPWTDQPRRLLAESRFANTGLQSRRSGLDSRLTVRPARRRDDSLVEFVFAHRATSDGGELVADRESTDDVIDPDPFADVTALPAESPADPPANDDRVDWFEEETDQTAPELELSLEFAPNQRRRLREPEAEDITITSSIGPQAIGVELDVAEPFEADDWQVFDTGRLTSERTGEGIEFDQARLAVEERSAEEMGWTPVPFPDAAPETLEIGLELCWNRSGIGNSRRRRSGSSPQLHLRNTGMRPVSRIDLVRGALVETDFTTAQSFATQPISELGPQEEEAVPIRRPRASGESEAEIVSVVMTGFVGHMVTVMPAVSAAPKSDPVVVQPFPPRRQIDPLTEPKKVSRHPHLALTVGDVERLPKFRMLSLPMRVKNDGDVLLENVIIIAEVPKGLRHRFGSTVHYRVGRLAPGEERPTVLLLTSETSGTATVELMAADAATKTSSQRSADIRMTDERAPTEERAEQSGDSSTASSPDWRSTRRRRPPPP